MYLYHLVTYAGYHSIERITDFSHSTMYQIFGCTCALLLKWANKWITRRKLSDRRQAAQRFAKHKLFKHTTLIVDFADFPCWKRKPHGKKSKHHSFKLNKHETRVQMIISHDRIFRWVFGPYYPKDYDGDCLLRNRKQLKKIFRRGDVIIAD